MVVQTDGDGHSRLADGTPVAPNEDPYDGYKKLFAGLVAPTAPVSQTPEAPDPAVVGRLARRQSVLDYVTKDIAALRVRLSPEDRVRADAQLDCVRTMEQRLSASLATPSGGGGGVGGTACSAPIQMAGLNVKSDAVFPELCRMQLDLIVSAFACDLTRIAAINFRGADYQVYKCGFDPVNQPAENFHGLSHNGPRDDFAAFIKAKALLFRIVGEAANKLKSIPEGNGTMLDNTLIFCGTEIGRGHTLAQHQYLTIGGKNLGVATGRWLRYGNDGGPGSGTPHQRALVAFLNCMGLPDTTFAEGPDTGAGPMNGYLA
jgi:hypothetical protein